MCARRPSAHSRLPREPLAALQAFTGSPARGGELTINPAEVDGRSGSTDYYKHTDDTRAFQQVLGVGPRHLGLRSACGETGGSGSNGGSSSSSSST